MALASIEVVPPFEILSLEINLSNYHADIPWLLAITAALGSTIGSAFYYFLGRGTRQLSGKLQAQLDKFDVSRFEKSTIAVTFSSALISLPPFTIVSVVAGITRVSLWTYLPISLIGKIMRFSLVVYAADSAIHFINKLIF